MPGFQDPYCYPGTQILRNHFDLRDEQDLSEAEGEFAQARLIQLQAHPEPGDYDLPHLARIHGRIFGDVYPWAGEIRRVDIGKGSTQFMPHTLIPRGAEFLFNRIREQNLLRGLDRSAFIAAAAENLADLNHLHPSREGNGRSQRAFMLQLARDGGWDIAWEEMDPEVNIHASSLSTANPQTPAMRDLLEPLVAPYEPPPAPDPSAPTTQSSPTTADLRRAQESLAAAQAAQMRAGKRPPRGNAAGGGGYRPGPGSTPSRRPKGPRR